MKRLTTTAIVILVLVGCSSTAKYKPQHLGAQELAWHFDNGLEVHQDGKKVSGGVWWGGLEDTVGCVEAAADEASGARNKAVIGKSIVFGSGAIAIGGSGVMLASVFQEDTDTNLLLTGAGVAIGGLLTMIVGVLVDAGATPDAIDAVNIYNDEYASTPGCAAR